METMQSVDDWKKLIGQWERSGMSQRRFCERNKVSFWSFRSWRTKLNEMPSESSEFVEVQAKESESRREARGEIRIYFPNGIIMEAKADIGTDWISAILRAERHG